MDSSPDPLDEALELIRQLTDDSLLDVERRLAVLEANRLPSRLPLLPIMADTDIRGRDRLRLESIKRRLDRLEREVYLDSVREKL